MGPSLPTSGDAPVAPTGPDFTSGGRPANGLYTAAIVLGGLGVGALVAGLVLSAYDPGLAGILLLAGIAAAIPGFIAGARYQLIARRGRPPERYRGPSPLILFVLQFALVNVLGIFVFLLAGGPDSSFGFLFAAIALLAGYLFVVWLFVVRPGALSWRDMLNVERIDASHVVTDIAIGSATMFGAAIVAAIVGALIATLLGTTAPEVVPAPKTATEIALTALAAGIIVPIGEELFFRGYTMSAWMRDLGPRSALIWATVFFALIHIVNIQIPADSGLDGVIDGGKQAILEVSIIGPVGLALGWLYLKRGLIAAISGHAAFNLLGVLILALQQNLPPGTGT
jgi:membrane protease YdiL (CAAX protease family)